MAAIDCGTNSLRLLIADVAAGPTTASLRDVTRRAEIVRLGAGVDAHGVISDTAMQRAFGVIEQYAQDCRAAGVQALRFVATSASRDARNAADFTGGVHERLGVWPEVISGDEEAELSFLGATAGLGVAGPDSGSAADSVDAAADDAFAFGPADDPSGAASHPTNTVCVVDLGGGSTEVVTGVPGRPETVRGLSMNVGCVRLTERYLASDPPTSREINSATTEIDAQLDTLEQVVPLRDVRVLIGLAGSVTTITAHALELPEYDSARVHGSELSVQQTLTACDDLLQRSRQQRMTLGFMHEGRADVIGAGALIWARVVHRLAERASISAVVASEHDILDGVALRLGETGTP